MRKDGAIAKREGHRFEALLAEKIGYEIDGGSMTKVDIYGKYRMSIKNAAGGSTQVYLVTQDRFIEALNIKSTKFVREFFGGDTVSEYPRHRKTLSDFSPEESSEFLNELNNKLPELFDIIFVKGYGQRGAVDVLGWAHTKNDVDSVKYYDLAKIKKDFVKSKWEFNETTLHLRVNGKTLVHLQMKGSGKKYTNMYHGVLFHLHGHFRSEWNITI